MPICYNKIVHFCHIFPDPGGSEKGAVMSETISILISVYNAQATLDACLESITAQTYHDLEIVLVDDGSKDRTLDLCLAWAERDSRIHVIHQENGGLSAGRNTGLANAHGDWIMFADGDDRLAPDAVETLLASRTGEEDIISGCCLVVSEGMPDDTEHFLDGDQLLRGDDKRILFRELLFPELMHPLCRYIDIGVAWGKLYRASFLRERGLRFDFSAPINEDNIFNTHAFYYARAVRYVDRPLYIYSYNHYQTYANGLSTEQKVARFQTLCGAKRKALESHGLLELPELQQVYRAYVLMPYLTFQRDYANRSHAEYLAKVRELRTLEPFRILFQPKSRVLASPAPFLAKFKWLIHRMNLHGLMQARVALLKKLRRR